MDNIKIEVCTGANCQIKGGYNVLVSLKQMAEHEGVADKMSIKPVFCTRNCAKAVAVTINGEVHSVSGLGARDFFRTEILKLVK